MSGDKDQPEAQNTSSEASSSPKAPRKANAGSFTKETSKEAVARRGKGQRGRAKRREIAWTMKRLKHLAETAKGEVAQHRALETYLKYLAGTAVSQREVGTVERVDEKPRERGELDYSLLDEHELHALRWLAMKAQGKETDSGDFALFPKQRHALDAHCCTPPYFTHDGQFVAVGAEDPNAAHRAEVAALRQQLHEAQDALARAPPTIGRPVISRAP